MKIAVITSGYFPVPDARGGAVEHLVTLLLRGGEKSSKDVFFDVYSCWDSEAVSMAEAFNKSSFRFIKAPSPIRFLDRCSYLLARYALKKEKAFSYRFIFQRLHFIAQVRKGLLSERYDAVLVENQPLLLMPFKDKRLFDSYEGRIFFHLHNELTGHFGCKEQMLSVARLLGISDYVCKSFSDNLPEFETDRLRILRNCLEVEMYGTDEAAREGRRLREESGFERDDLVVLFSGRLSPEKGVRELLQAFTKVHDLVPAAKLVIVGATYYSSDATSSYEQELRDLARPLGSAVLFTGYVAHEQMPAYYAMADVCATPSVWEEPACMSALEAIAAGKPLVATRSGGMSEYLDESFALLVERGSGLVDSLADAIAYLLQNEDIRANLALAALKVRGGFSSAAYFERFVSLIEEGLSMTDCKRGLGF